MSNMKFIQRALAGDVLDLEEIDDDIDVWHESKHQEQALHEWLGMTELEYSLFVERPEALRSILQARKLGMDITDFIEATQDSTSLAARGAEPEELLMLSKWLRNTGRI